MKRILIMAMVGVMVAPSVWAVAQFVRFYDPMFGSVVNASRWYGAPALMTYTESVSGFSGRAVVQGRCSKLSGSIGEQEDVLNLKVSSASEISSGGSKNKYCWCQLVYPFVSNFIYCPYQTAATGVEFSNAATCALECSGQCSRWVLETAFAPFEPARGFYSY